MFSGTILASFIGISSAFSVPIYPSSSSSSDREFEWADIAPSKELKYHKCYGEFECARLEVPLDWSNPSNPNTVAIAITKLPAVVDIADESFGGTVVINPGGPSGSGVATVLWGGKNLQKVVDSDKHFEILSFDPRGVQFTTPSVNCFQDDPERTTLQLLALGAGSLDSNEDALNTMWSIHKSIGLLCAQTRYGRFGDGTSVRQFVSTALVARDMVAIVDQVEAHRQKEVESRRNLQTQQAVLQADSDDGPPLLNYWGLSYGSYLGNTFASMFPHRIGRMILDGVVDADDYAATGWTTNLQDNNKTWAKFFEDCFEAGDKCVLSDPSIQNPEEMQDQVEAFLAELKHDPMALVANGNAYILTYANMRAVIHVFLYQPILLWPLLAMVLKSLIERDDQGAVSALKSAEMIRTASEASQHFRPILPQVPFLPMISEALQVKELPLPANYPWQLEAAVSILCGDGDDITSRTKDGFTDYMALLQSQSPLVGALWADITLACVHWRRETRPSETNRFTGPFRSNLSDYDSRASPLLFIGNTADPVTPVRNAVKMSLTHEGSVVLTQDMPGHCAGSSNPSVCTFGIVKAFFANGTLPENGLVCKAAVKPWEW